ncbi:MAG: hypothetical protein WC612_06285 [Bdellovibrionales bacterium]|jgi:hypothetical protein
MPNFVVNTLSQETATIAAGAALSGAVNLGGLRLFGLVMPAAWTAAGITFQVSYDGGTSWSNLYDANGNEVSVTVAASRAIALDPVTFAAISMIKVRSGTAAAPVNQIAAAAVQLVLRSV